MSIVEMSYEEERALLFKGKEEIIGRFTADDGRYSSSVGYSVVVSFAYMVNGKMRFYDGGYDEKNHFKCFQIDFFLDDAGGVSYFGDLVQFCSKFHRSLGLNELEATLKSLRYVTKRTEKALKDQNSPRTIGEMVSLISKVMNLKHWYFSNSDNILNVNCGSQDNLISNIERAFKLSSQ